MNTDLVESETGTRSERTSDILYKLVTSARETLSTKDVLDAVGDRSFGFLIFLLGVPNCIPMPPPIATICALVLLLIAVQIGLGRTAPSLPRVLLAKSAPTADARAAFEKIRPALLWLERLSSRRLTWEGPGGAYLTALFLAATAIGMLTAIPIIGQIPWGVAVCLLGLALVEHDGVLFIAGLVVGGVAASFSMAAVFAVAEAAQRLF